MTTREEEVQQSINKLWTILDGDTTISESMKIMGATEKDIKDADEAIRKDKTGGLYNQTVMEIMIAVYGYLKYLGGIDTTKIFNLGTHSFDKEPSRNDIGIMDEQLYLYQGDWVKWR